MQVFNLVLGIGSTTETLSDLFLISPTYLKLVPYSENSLLLLVPGIKSDLPQQKGRGVI